MLKHSLVEGSAGQVDEFLSNALSDHVARVALARLRRRASSLELAQEDTCKSPVCGSHRVT